MSQGLTGAAVYRVRQFLAAITADQLTRSDWVLVERCLSPAQLALFERMASCDQHHAVAVARTLIDEGWSDSELIQAALLHDVGKVDGGLHLGYRVVIVLLRAFWPAGFKRLAAGNSGWRRPFYVHRHHPQIGARLVEGAGSSRRVVDLILQHQSTNVKDNAGSGALAALQIADGAH